MLFKTLNLLGLLSVMCPLAMAKNAKKSPPSPESILAASDRARGATAQGLTWKIHIKTTENGTAASSAYEVKVKGLNVLAQCTAPPRDKDQTILFNDRNLWIFKPGLRKPISISPRQRLSGQAANGDIATTNYARDYSATLKSIEPVNGVPAYRLQLKAKSKDVTYDAINYWVTQDSQLGVKAEFLTLEGKIFKRATFKYENKATTEGKSVPFVSEMNITDAMFQNNVTIITYEKPESAQISDTLFNVNNIAR